MVDADALIAATPDDAPPHVMIIAEIGVNHDGDPGQALRLIDAAAAAGADAVKTQLFHPERLLSNQARLALYQHGKAADPRELLARLALGVEQLRPIAAHARQAGLRFIVTPFSLEDVADLAELGVDAVKIASPDAVNLPLLERAMSLGKPMIVSAGTCELEELGATAALLRGHRVAPPAPGRAGGPNGKSSDRPARFSGRVQPIELPGATLLQCVSSYPTPRQHAAIGGMVAMRQAFGLPVGYSDHTPELDTGALAVAAGAVVLEKHLTHDKHAPGPDHAASLTGDELGEYVRRVRDASAVLGPIRKCILPIEGDVRGVSRQSICALRDLPAGHVLTSSDLTVKRPGFGIPAARLAQVIGRTLRGPVKANDLLRDDDLVRYPGDLGHP